MTSLLVVRFLHLVAAATWVGGLVVIGPLVVALRRAGVERDALRAAARAFAVVTWTAMAVAIATGVAQVELLALPWTTGALHLKLATVATAALLAAVHTLTARRTGERARGIVQGLILLASLAIVAAAVQL